jgi:anti-anti-sigma regulatory factor
MIFEKTVNQDAVVFVIKSFKDDENFLTFLDFCNLEKDIVIFDCSKIDSVSNKFISTLLNFQRNSQKKKIMIQLNNSSSMKNILESIDCDKILKIIN